VKAKANVVVPNLPIAQVGDDVKTLKVGDRVALEPPGYPCVHRLVIGTHGTVAAMKRRLWQAHREDHAVMSKLRDCPSAQDLLLGR
jgi:hypothetical protein